jgi:ribonuclease BN (tRNA processing enzyme)
MRLTTIGTGTISLTPHRACAGHVVEAGAVRLLLDCGSGVAHRMSELGLDWWGITHVALTHFHADHFADLPSLLFAWKHARRPGRAAPLTLVGPPGTRALVQSLAAAFGQWLADPGFPFAIVELPPDASVALGAGAAGVVTLSARAVPHTAESVAYSIEHEQRRVVYTGDTGWDPSLGEWATGCDVLLCECSLPEAWGIPQHLTPERCGALAAIARPRLLALTHLYPPVLDVDIPAAVRSRFAGDVVVAHDGWTHAREEMPCWS